MGLEEPMGKSVREVVEVGEIDEAEIVDHTAILLARPGPVKLRQRAHGR